jgi:hypothetical protein
MPSPSPVQPTRRTLVIIWSALAATLVGFAAFAAVAPFPSSPEMRVPLLLTVALMGVAELVAGSVVVASIRRRALATGGGGPATAMTQTIVACSLAEGMGLFACIGLLLTDDPLFLAVVAACLVVMVRWFPSEARWARLSGEAPRSRMIRE